MPVDVIVIKYVGIVVILVIDISIIGQLVNPENPPPKERKVVGKLILCSDVQSEQGRSPILVTPSGYCKDTSAEQLPKVSFNTVLKEAGNCTLVRLVQL
jgi:hypothetical protein